MRTSLIALGVALVALAILSPNALAKKKKKMDAPQSKEITTASGLKYIDLVVGTGETPDAGETAVVNYTGWLENGTAFDSNVDPKFKHVEPFKFVVGQHQVIAGWDEGVGSMKVGGKRKLIIPPALGYGARNVGNGLIPPNSTLIFEVELKSIR